jgi:uroporphyrin-III C-methyltransferase/precorrin-2 dehydrogenase/sirohydrochlorin ferrochelatase
MDHLPIFLQLRGVPAVVVGGGRIAQRKIELLLRVGARITVVAPELREELARRAAAGEITHRSAHFRPAHLKGAQLVIAATNLRALNATVSAAARLRAVPINVVDDPELSTFYFPAIVDRSPLIVAIGSNAQAPVLTRWVREQIEALLPGTLGMLARFIGERRKAVQQTLAPAARRAFWERIVRGTAGSRALSGDTPGAAHAYERELAAARLASSPATGGGSLGEVYLIGAGPGDADLLTLRALQLLQRADVVLHDRLVPPAVLERARRDAERVFVGKGTARGTRAAHTEQEQIHELMVRYARAGLRVARLKGGDPFVFGRGGEEVEHLARHGIPYLVVPGITAALGAAAATGIPLTHRALAQSVTLVTGHPLEDEALDWSALARGRQTVVFYMGVAHLERICARLRAAGADPQRPAALIERATLPGQRLVRGTLASIATLAHQAAISPPALLVVGEVAALAHSCAGCDTAGTPAPPLRRAVRAREAVYEHS